MIKYDKLFELLEQRNLKRTLLLSFISSKTLAKLGKGESINTDTIDALCYALDCQPGDIMEYVDDTSKLRKDVSVIEKWRRAFTAGMDDVNKMTKEELKTKGIKGIIKDSKEYAEKNK